ncbi:MAG: hypothetical protein QOJ00_521 [Actinomycetota bacterium]|jgi:amino acid transporter
MTYGSAGQLAGTGLAATGFALGGWLVGAVTLLLLGIACMQLARRSPALRP